jgi:putative spermidine/putrescine transport system permease protein
MSSQERFGRGAIVFRWALRTFAAVFCIFLIAPIFVFVPLSFSDLAILHYPVEHFSLRWYEQLVGSAEWRRALLNSLFIAGCSTGLATVLGVMASIGLSRSNLPGARVLLVIFMTPMIVPSVIVGVSMYLAFARVGLTNSYLGMILAHSALATPMVVVTVSAALARFDANLLRAAQGLGARPMTSFWYIILPLILPGVLAGAIFAFAVSFDDVVVALMVAGPEQRTLPVQMYARASDLFDLTIVAAATFMLCVAMLLMTALQFLKSSDSLGYRNDTAIGK